MSKSKAKPNVKNTIESIQSEHKGTTNVPKTVSAPSHLLFTKKNYQLMALGLLTIFVGYLLMLGKNNNVPGVEYPAADLYSFKRIILAPFVIIIGFLIEVYSIVSIRKN